jgi:hypothetical protein
MRTCKPFKVSHFNGVGGIGSSVEVFRLCTLPLTNVAGLVIGASRTEPPRRDDFVSLGASQTLLRGCSSRPGPHLPRGTKSL